MKTITYLMMALAMLACQPNYAGATEDENPDGKKSQGEPDDYETYVKQALEDMCLCFGIVDATTVEDIENMSETDAEYVGACLDKLDENYPYMDEAIEEIGDEKLEELARQTECSDIIETMIYEMGSEPESPETDRAGLDEPEDIAYVDEALSALCDCFDQAGISTPEEMNELSPEKAGELEDCILALSETYPEMAERIEALSDTTYKDILISKPCATIIISLF